jgi:predicted  nucleic acid-binding Zn-ribbon protein
MNSQFAERSNRVVWTIVLAGVAMAMPGCDRGDEGDRAIQAARDAFNVLTNNGGEAHPSDDDRAKALTSIASQMQPLTSGANQGQAAAASLMLARAKGGLADIQASQAGALERQAINQITQVRAQLEVWLVQSSRAAVLESYDPSKEQAAIAGAVQGVEREVNAANDAKAKAQKAIADLEKQITTHLAEAKRLRETAASQREQASRVSATEGLALVERAAATQRQADGLDVKASELRIQIAGLTPLVAQAERELARLATQKKSLAAAGESLTQRQASNKKLAQDARAEASAAAAAITRQAGELASFRADKLTSLGDAAIKGYRDAASAASKAGAGATGEGVAAAKIASASFHQSAGDAAFIRARGLEGHLVLLNTLASAKPALPDAGKFADEAKSLDEQFKATLASAKESFENAKQGFENASPKADATKQRLTDIIALLNSVLEGKKTLSPAPAETAPAGSAAGASAAAPAGDPKAAVKAMLEQLAKAMETGELAKIEPFFILKSEGEKQALQQVAKVAAASHALDVAAKVKLGKGLKDLGGGGPMGSAAELISPDAKMTVQSDTVVTIDAGPMPGAQQKAVLKDGSWKIDGLFPPGMEGMAAMMTPMMGKMADMFNALAADVQSGKIATPEALMGEMEKRMMGVMGGMMPGGGGKGGG